jgi:hypothetical protein
VGDGKSCVDNDECKLLGTNLHTSFATWKVAGSSTQVKWQVVGGALVYTNPVTKNYETPGEANGGTVTSGAFTVGANNKLLTIELINDVEELPAYDQLTLTLLQGGVASQVLLDKATLKASAKSASYSVDLTPWVGKSVQLQWGFDTVDEFGNNTAGPAIAKMVLGGNADCNVNAACVNTPGAYQCACKPGFFGDGKATCSDVNECLFTGGVNLQQDVSKWSVAGSSLATKWQVVNGGLYYGDPKVMNYDDGGKANKGTATSPLFTVAAPNTKLSFSLVANVESSSNYDKLSLLVLVNGVPTTVAVKSSAPPAGAISLASSAAPVAYTVDLGAYAGKAIQLQWSFDSVDDYGNSTAGVVVASMTLNNQLGDCSTNAVCTNTAGGYSCACKPGFGGDGKSCQPL